jgi:hypothetical protein
MTNDEQIADAIIIMRNAIAEAIHAKGTELLMESDLSEQQIAFIMHVALNLFNEDFKASTRTLLPERYAAFEEAIAADLKSWRTKHLS